jgi:hypothetical protein
VIDPRRARLEHDERVEDDVERDQGRGRQEEAVFRDSGRPPDGEAVALLERRAPPPLRPRADCRHRRCLVRSRGRGLLKH